MNKDGRDKLSRPTWALVGVTLALVLVGLLQWCTLDKTDKTLQLQQRAWLAPRRLEPPDNFMSKTADYTRVTLKYENVGKEPATKANLNILPGLIDYNDWQDPKLVEQRIDDILSNLVCDDVPVNPDGPAIYPGSRTGIDIGFGADDVKKINAHSHYALAVGCFVYETLGERHQSNVCMILEPLVDNADTPAKWNSVFCPIHTGAN